LKVFKTAALNHSATLPEAIGRWIDGLRTLSGQERGHPGVGRGKNCESYERIDQPRPEERAPHLRRACPAWGARLRAQARSSQWPCFETRRSARELKGLSAMNGCAAPQHEGAWVQAPSVSINLVLRSAHLILGRACPAWGARLEGLRASRRTATSEIEPVAMLRDASQRARIERLERDEWRCAAPQHEGAWV
jgi:hypothetical protein